MSFNSLAATQPVRLFLRAMLAAALVALTGCATHYVDGANKEILPSQLTKPAQPKPVQLVFEFQSKGVSNARATEMVKGMVSDNVKASGLFAQVDEKPVAGNALLSVTINNVPLTDDAFSKGFLTGLTFGAAGSQVTDGYVGTVRYIGTGNTTPVIKTARHAIHTTLGASGAPANAYKASSLDDALRTMVRQLTSAALNELSKDPSFK